jgi:hypothetical protein
MSPELYRTDFPMPDDRSFKNYGKRWTDEEKDKLAWLFSRFSLPGICRQLERPKAGVLAKLCEANLIHHSYRDGKYYMGAKPEPVDVTSARQAGKSAFFAHLYGTSETTASTIQGKSFDAYIMDEVFKHHNIHDSLHDAMRHVPLGPDLQQLLKEPTMNTAPNIETKTFINGTDASAMTDAQIFSKIATLEAEHNRLDTIKAKPTKLVKVMEQITADIAALVTYVDGR